MARQPLSQEVKDAEWYICTISVVLRGLNPRHHLIQFLLWFNGNSKVKLWSMQTSEEVESPVKVLRREQKKKEKRSYNPVGMER